MVTPGAMNPVCPKSVAVSISCPTQKIARVLAAGSTIQDSVLSNEENPGFDVGPRIAPNTFVRSAGEATTPTRCIPIKVPMINRLPSDAVGSPLRMSIPPDGVAQRRFSRLAEWRLKGTER
jgi:hypothetical protein